MMSEGGARIAVMAQHEADVEAVLATRGDNGADHWATADGRLARGGPFSTLEAPPLLVELGVPADHEALRGAAELLLRAWRPDGRFRLAPSGAIYPCHTINAAWTLCRLGRAHDERLHATYDHLLATLHDDGGWRCRKFSYGRGPETVSSNPGPTLTALDVLRLADLGQQAPAGAVDLLLGHWERRAPLGPCHFGIGTLFSQVEYPFASYNLFRYVYVLSFYARARADPRFRAALEVLRSRTVDGQIVVERVHRRLAGLSFCRLGEPSQLGTARYAQIEANVAAG